jgi:ABC-type oligopeptide transport system substrate-binding subunit
MNRPSSLLLVFVLALAGCGDTSDPSAPQVLHRGTGEEPESLDIHKSNSTEAGHVQRDLAEGLVGYSPTGELVPAVASEWTVSDDGTEYRFSLRPEARWSNGEPLTAEDFVYSYRRLVDPATAALYTQSIQSVENATAILAGEAPVDSLGVEASDVHTLVIRLERPTPYFLSLLAHSSMFPVHAPSIATHGDRYARPGNLVSNGAYRLAAWEVGSYIALERNEHYWDDANTSIDRVRHYVTPEPMAELNRYRAGELHVTRTIPPGMFAEMQRDRPDEVRVSPALGVYYYGFNLSLDKYAGNPKLREALSMAIDRETIVEMIGRGEEPAYSWVPPGTAGFDGQVYSWADMSAAERHREAEQLFEEAGYGPGNLPAVEIHYNTHQTHRQIAVAIQSMWKDVLGVEAELINQDFQVLVSNIQGNSTDVFRLNWSADYNDPHSFLEVFETGNSSNFVGYEDPEYDDLMARAERQTDPERRKIYLEEAERRMLRNYPVIPLYFYINRNMVSPAVSGWEDNVLNYHYSRHLSLADNK